MSFYVYVGYAPENPPPSEADMAVGRQELPTGGEYDYKIVARGIHRYMQDIRLGLTQPPRNNIDISGCAACNAATCGCDIDCDGDCEDCRRGIPCEPCDNGVPCRTCVNCLPYTDTILTERQFGGAHFRRIPPVIRNVRDYRP